MTSSNSSTDLSGFGFGGDAPASEKTESSGRKPRKRPEDDEQINVPEEDISAPGRAWYFIHTYSGHEFKVRDSILLQIKQVADADDKVFHVIVPTEEEIEIRDGQRRTVRRKLYPGYVLLQTMVLVEGDPPSDAIWHLVRDTTGVTGFVSTDNNRPVPLSTDEVKHILQATLHQEAPRLRVSFQIGENVRIVSGPFEELVGTVDELNMEKGKLRVRVNMLGRETPVELDLTQVVKM